MDRFARSTSECTEALLHLIYVGSALKGSGQRMTLRDEEKLQSLQPVEGESGKCIEKSVESSNGNGISGSSPSITTKPRPHPPMRSTSNFPSMTVSAPLTNSCCRRHRHHPVKSHHPSCHPPPPATANSILNGLTYNSCTANSTATAMAAVAAAATVIPPGAPSAAASAAGPISPARHSTVIPSEAIVVVLPTPPTHYQTEQQLQQPQQLQLTTIEPLISVN
ncbi:unnamed protein product [Ceratitis capitata]|uniref:(Mediterranean fruit fly) hypothetical protein n=1 Tax=Ceratitis capitata TaxID=7213 RepID=A0A811UPW9_CERCA|nr:unnamed protein product [Ceratitis capitata]